MPKFIINANNKMGSAELFHKRALYRFFALAFGTGQATLEMPGVKDYWRFEDFFYGKVDPNFNSVSPNIDKLVQLEGADGSILVFDFVAAAFKKFKSFFKMPLKFGTIAQGTPISDPVPTRGFHSPEPSYNDMIVKFMDSFNSYLFERNRYYEIMGPQEYTKHFFAFYFAQKEAIVLKSCYLMSSQVNALSSGLCLEIADLNPADDEAKMSFINSPNFSFYRQAAIQSGFLIDKNIPWRLKIDLRSPVVSKNLVTAGVDGISTVGNVFLNYFTPSYRDDINLLQQMVVLGYNRFYEIIPLTGEHGPDAGSELPTSIAAANCIRKIGKLSSTDDLGFPFAYWIKKYIQMKNKETGTPFSKNQLLKMEKDIIRMLAGPSLNVPRYINEKFRIPWIYPGSLVYEKLKQEFRENGDFSLDKFDEYVKMIVMDSINSIY